MTDRPDCRILGPLEVLVEGCPIRLGGQRPQVLLATLVLDGGHPVSTERLAEAVWGAELPTSLRAQLSIHVSTLRKAFGTAVIDTVPGGYRLRRDAVRVDAYEAESLVEQARAAAAAGRTGEAVDLLAAAQRRWRGPVLAGLDSSLVAAAATRFEELWLTIVEERARLELDRGGHVPLIGELTAAVGAHPYRERLRGQLMVALARSGRAADALEVYREGRRVLVDELGVEPGPELRQLEQRILLGDEDMDVGERDSHVLAGAPAGQDPPSRPVPTELPNALVTFTGRTAEVAALSASLPAADGRPIVVSGPGGVGKSALAIAVAQRVADQFPEGQLYANLHGTTPHTTPPSGHDVLAQFLRSLGVPAADVPVDAETAVARFRELTADRRLLVVLDDAADATQVRRLLPAGNSSTALVTSRRRLDALDTAEHHQLDVLAAAEAEELLARIAGPHRLDAEAGAAADLVRLCGRLPLAVAIAGARLAARPSLSVQALVERLAVERRRLGELRVDDHDVRASFAVSYADLDRPEVARMFRLLGVLDGSTVSVEVAAALADVPVALAEDLLGELVAAQLATRTGERYGLHDLLRLFARELAEVEDGRRGCAAALRRAMHCYVATAHTAAMVVAPCYRWRLELVPVELVHPGVALSSVPEVNAWIEAERENLLLAAEQAAVGDEPAVAVSLAVALDMPLENRGRWREQLVVSEIVRRAAERTQDPHHLGLAHNDVGWALSALDRVADAIPPFEHALEMWRAVGHLTGEALTLHGHGVACRALGRHDDALASLQRAETLAEQLGDRGRQAMCQSAIGLTYQRLGQYDDAIAAHEKSVAMAREASSWRTELIALGNMAEAFRLAGELRTAVRTFREVLERGRSADYAGTYWEAEHLWGLGMALHDLGIGGRECWLAAADILADLGLIGAEERVVIGREPIPATPDVIASQL
ncbi:MAG: tetratricopeptide repeat protein [Streptosporangiales bacterium]|nr:tetratricopeptide repeat protein [Streptosporangiales bacterium]